MAPAGKRGDKAVLSGPKSPCWKCGCGEPSNWACRIKCRHCGRDAPVKVVAAAKAAHKQPAPTYASGPKGAWAAGPPRSVESIVAQAVKAAEQRFAKEKSGAGTAKEKQLAKELAALKKELAKELADKPGVAEDMETDTTVSPEVLQAKKDEVKWLKELPESNRKFVENHAQKLATAQAELDALFATKRNALPLATRHANAESRLKDRQKRLDKKVAARESLAEQRTELDKLISGMDSEITDAAAEVDKLKQEVADLGVQKAAEVRGGPAVPTPPQAGHAGPDISVREASILPHIYKFVDGEAFSAYVQGVCKESPEEAKALAASFMGKMQHWTELIHAPAPSVVQLPPARWSQSWAQVVDSEEDVDLEALDGEQLDQLDKLDTAAKPAEESIEKKKERLAKVLKEQKRKHQVISGIFKKARAP